MRSFLNLFGPSPFTALQLHMQIVSRCVQLLEDLFSAIDARDFIQSASIAESIRKLEHQADIVKNDIRNHLPKSIFLPIDRSNLLEILSMQDHLADNAESVADLVTMKNLPLPEPLKADFMLFLKMSIKTFKTVEEIISELGELLEFSFGGVEAEKVKALVNETSMKERETNIALRGLLKGLFNIEEDLSYGSFYLWVRIIEGITEISKLSERLSSRVRMTLESE